MAGTRHRDDKEFYGALTLESGASLTPASGSTVDLSSATLTLADGAVTLAKMAVESVDSDQYVDGSIDTAHIADSQVTATKQAFSVSAFTDEAAAITADMEIIHLSTTGAGTNALTNSSMITGKLYWVHMIAQSTGTYEMASVDGGTLTFNAAGERAAVYYDGTALRTVHLEGATIV